MIHQPVVTVTCPVCEVGEVDCCIDPGEARITSGPPDGWYPGSPAALDDYSAGCECGDSPLVDSEKYMRALEERALEKEML